MLAYYWIIVKRTIDIDSIYEDCVQQHGHFRWQPFLAIGLSILIVLPGGFAKVIQTFFFETENL